MEQRGKIINRARAGQIKDFSGLRYKNITPTDIDGLLDFANKVFIFFELKCEGTTLLTGQRLALERLTDNLEKAGKHSLTIVATHNTDPDEDIGVATCRVVEWRYNQKWVKPKEKKYTVKQLIDLFLTKHLPYYLAENKPKI